SSSDYYSGPVTRTRAWGPPTRPGELAGIDQTRASRNSRNAWACSTLGITISPALLARTDAVIE
ncbi:MAG: hypothetical protein WCD25_25370, partial [Pseudolabrys sp.]